MKLSKSVFIGPACSGRLTGDCAHVRTTMWVIYGRVPLLVQTWLHPLLRDCLRGRLGSLQRLTRLNVLMVIIKPRHLTSMMVTIMLTGMFSSLAWAEPMMIVPVGPQIDTTNDLSFRHEQPGLIINLVPCWPSVPLEKPSQLTWGRDLPSSAITNSVARLWRPAPNRQHCRRQF